MAEELGTRDVFEQIDSRLGNVEQDTRTLRTEMNGLRSDVRLEISGFRSEVQSEISGLRTEMHARFVETNAFSQWIIGMVLVS